MKKIILSVFVIIILFFIGIFIYEKYFDKSYLAPTPANESTQIPLDILQFSKNQPITIIIYTVQKNDTLQSLAAKFNISTQTIKWANNLTSDILTPGQKLQILPVTGVAHKVVAGDTIYSLSKKYHANPQDIADFPGNNFANPETLTLTPGEILIIPGGSM